MTAFDDITTATAAAKALYDKAVADGVAKDAEIARLKALIPAPTPTPTPVPTGRLQWGGWIYETVNGVLRQAPWDAVAVNQFEANSGRHADIIHWSSPWASAGTLQPFLAGTQNLITNRNSTPLFSWGSNPGTGEFTNARIAAGSQDTYIRAWATAAKTWGKPLYLRLNWEMNATWFPWGAQAVASPSTYVAMWRRVHGIFTSVGASNVKWVWCPNIDPGNLFAPIQPMYPGDAYVDFTGLDGYNGANPWQSYAALYGPTYDKIMGFAPTKPMIVCEVGSTESGGSKAAWITDMFKAIPVRTPKVAAVVWFNKPEIGPGGHTDWSIETSASAQAAIKAALTV